MLRRLRNWFAGTGAHGAGVANAVAPAQTAQASVALELALAARPEDADLNYRMGMRCLADGDAAVALDHFHVALHYAPEVFDACAGRVNALHRLGRSDEEADAYREFLRTNPGHPGAAYALARWHHARGEYEPAVELLRPLAGHAPVNMEACNLLGLILGRELGQFDEAERLLRRALEADPFWCVALSNLGWILMEKGDHAQGLKLVDAVLERNPDDHETRLVLSYMNLKRGEFEAGWRDYAAREHSRYAAPGHYDFARWHGEQCDGKTLLIVGEQGFGDQIMFASCFDDAMRRAGRCVIECDPRLAGLFRRSFARASIRPVVHAGEHAVLPAQTEAIDLQIPMGSLPGFFRNRWEDFPRHGGYLRADPGRIAYWRARLDALGPGPKIGLSWRGGVAATRRHLRCIDLKEFLPILDLPAIFVSLQYGDCAGDLSRLNQEQHVTLPHWQDALDDYDETAALICALDLVISVCTAVIHLAGALGKPVWVLVPAIAEWRYLDRGELMPWYPSARLFRQTEPGQWKCAIKQIAEQLPAGFPAISR